MEESSGILIDEAYEFCAPRFYAFNNGETENDVRNAELWFETALSHAPSPFMMRIKGPRSVQLSSLCDFGDAEKRSKASKTVSSTIGTTSNASENMGLEAETMENLNPNMTNGIATEEGTTDKQSCEVSSEAVCKEDRSTKIPTCDKKIKPVNLGESATCSSQDVCTPKPPSMSRKGGKSSDLGKHQTAKKIASALKNPSAFKSKMQSQLSQTKSVKPVGARRETGHLKGSIGAPNLVQENQAIKRQKLDDGKSRQILSIRPPNLPHKTRTDLRTSTFMPIVSLTTKTSQEGRKIYLRDREPVGPFVSMAEMMKKFQSSTRDVSLSRNSVAQGKPTKLALTTPKEPEFETTQRARSIKVKSSAELEEEMMAKMPKFKALPLNRKIFEAPSLPPLPKSAPQQPDFQEFHLETMERANRNAEGYSVVSTETHKKYKWKPHYLTEPKTPALQTSLRARPTKVKSSLEIEQEELEKIPKFKARPLNKKIFESMGELGLFCNKKKQVTIPQVFHFAIDERIPPSTTSSVTDLFDKLSLNSEPNLGKPIPRITKPNPFQLHTEERGAEKERKLLTELIQKQMEEERARIPKAYPYPYTTDYPVIPPKPEPKECTKPEPFQLESLVRHEEKMKKEMEERRRNEIEAAQMRIFKAQPILNEDPIPLPEKERRPLTEVQEFNLHVEHRAVERTEFDKKVKEKEMMYKRNREEAEAARQMEEEKALKQLRRTLVPHARPIPTFANPFVPQKSGKETTKAKSPKLRVCRRKERKDSSTTANAIKAAASAAAALMR